MKTRLRNILRTLKACRALIKMKVAEGLQYRTAALAHTSVNVVYGILHIVFFTVFFTYGNPHNTAITLAQAISYAWIMQILYNLTAMPYLGIEEELKQKIVDGNVALELCRPLELYAHWFAKNIANRVSNSVWVTLFTLAVALLVPSAIGLSPPDSMLGFAFFLLSACSALLLVTAYTMLLIAIRLGLTWGDGPISTLALLAMVLGGGYLPLQLWPDFMQRVLLLQPFAGRLDIPARLFIGSMPTEDALWAICLQLIWTVVFIILGKVIMNRNISRLIVQGG